MIRTIIKFISITAFVILFAFFGTERVLADSAVAVSVQASTSAHATPIKAITETYASTSDVVRAKVANVVAQLQTDRTEAKNELKAHLSNFKTRIQAWHSKLLGTTPEKKVKLDANAKVRVETVLDVILARYTNITTQMDSISSRLADNISSIQSKTGVDMSSSLELLAQADAKRDATKDDIASAKADINAELDATTSKEEIKADIETVKDSLKDAYAAYKAVITSIRSEVGANATATASTSASAW